MDLPTLPTMKKYLDRISSDTATYIQWSEALFQCPICKVGAVHRDNKIILPSYPPKNLYKCFNCGEVFYR